MPKRAGRAHTAKEHKIHDAVKRSNPKLSDTAAWKITMANSSGQRGRRKTHSPNTINYRGRRHK